MKFRRQHPIGPYVVDFFCHGAKLVVEVDGMSHEDKMAQDAAKMKHIESQGYRILRVTNEDVMRDLDTVTREIARLGGDVSGFVPPHVRTALAKKFSAAKKI